MLAVRPGDQDGRGGEGKVINLRARIALVMLVGFISGAGYALATNNPYPKTGSESTQDLVNKHEKSLNAIYDGTVTLGSGTLTNLKSTGTATFNAVSISSSTGTATVTNLNADLLNGNHASALLNPTVQNDVTSSRAYGSVYQNTTGKPMFVSVRGRNNTVGAGMLGYTDGSNPPTTATFMISTPNTNYSTTITLWVLPGNYYKAVAASGTPTLDMWTEWY